jgi:hypothetical protein
MPTAFRPKSIPPITGATSPIIALASRNALYRTPMESFVFRCRLNVVAMAGLPLDVQGDGLIHVLNVVGLDFREVTPFQLPIAAQNARVFP